jgi:diadenosine tetraphosphatase ApaH/serine/threonine PP2A family protein phosphatase
MTSAQRENLLQTETIAAFLEELHGGATLQAVADRLLPHGGPRSRQAIADYMKRGRMSARIQRAYAVAYGYTDDLLLRIHVQDLIAGPVPATVSDDALEAAQ